LPTIDHQVGVSDQLSVRYFIDHFDNAAIYNDENLLTYRGGSNQSRVRTQNAVASWKRTFTATLLNEFHVGYNRIHSRRAPPDGAPGIQELGVRLPVYPTLPSIGEIRVQDFLVKAQFRAELFNVFNQVNFDLPNRNVSGGRVRDDYPHASLRRGSADPSVRVESGVLTAWRLVSFQRIWLADRDGAHRAWHYPAARRGAGMASCDALLPGVQRHTARAGRAFRSARPRTRAIRDSGKTALQSFLAASARSTRSTQRPTPTLTSRLTGVRRTPTDAASLGPRRKGRFSARRPRERRSERPAGAGGVALL
jgi:hypothetical protein